MLTRRPPAVLALALLATAGCVRVAGAPTGPAAEVVVAGRALAITAAGRDVCVGGGTAPALCLPAPITGEPVRAAALGPLDAEADLVAVLARRDVVLTGLGDGAVRSLVAGHGEAAALWLAVQPPGVAAACARYRTSGSIGRLAVHRGVTVDVDAPAVVAGVTGATGRNGGTGGHGGRSDDDC